MIVRDNENCSVVRTLNLVGDKWTLLVLRETFYGTRRFDDYLSAIGCARSILSDRLGKLVTNGILFQTEYHEEGQRRRLQYRLTEKGKELLNILIALKQWGDKWTHEKGCGPISLYHQGCRAKVKSKICCENGHILDSARDIRVRVNKKVRRA
jgi:DNA-binding HxlR family transcriptional regulator